MNDENETRTSPPPLPSGNAANGEGNLLSALLKTPARVAAAIAADRNSARAGLFFLVCAMLSHAVFGYAMGVFGGWQVGLMSAVKAPLIACCSLLLCFPSLYVFSAVGGAALSVSQAFMLGTSCLAMIGLLLVGLAPVAWLFSVSTASLAFVVALAFILWLLSIGFAVRYINTLTNHVVFQRAGGIVFWFVVFVLVSLQMTTCMRPLLTKPEAARGWWTTEKKFFLVHYDDCFKGRKTP